MRTTFVQHLLHEGDRFPGSTGEFTGLLTRIDQAAKAIARELQQAGLADRLGCTGEVNIQGEKVKKLDQWSNEIFVETLKKSRAACLLVSEEMDEPLHVEDCCEEGKYVVCFDPIDGSSNIDVNGILGTIFSVLRRRGAGAGHAASDALQKGAEQIAAGYVMYGPSTILVYTAGRSVTGFILDPRTGEFLLSHPNIRIPARGSTYSVNEGNYHRWHPQARRVVDYFREPDARSGRPYALRYAGSLVADLHRTLLEGGIYLYPVDADNPDKPAGKLRLLYEASPLGFIAEVAGGRASTGRERILDIQPSSHHQRVPLIIGSAEDVALAEEFHQGRR
ncbi:MAG: class 1 fructose-bisphosphatase [Nitrospirota bacterium]